MGFQAGLACSTIQKNKGIWKEGKKKGEYKTWDHVACMCGKTPPVLPRPTTT